MIIKQTPTIAQNTITDTEYDSPGQILWKLIQTTDGIYAKHWRQGGGFSQPWGGGY